MLSFRQSRTLEYQSVWGTFLGVLAWNPNGPGYPRGQVQISEAAHTYSLHSFWALRNWNTSSVTHSLMRKDVLSVMLSCNSLFVQSYWLMEILERYLPESFHFALATKDIYLPYLLFYCSWAFCRFYTYFFFCTWFLIPSACNSSMHLFSFSITGPLAKPDPCKTISCIWICLPCLFLHRFFVYASISDLKITSTLW